MGMSTSFMGGKGLSTSQMLSLLMNTLYKRFVEKDIKEFDAFNVAILDTFNTINMALPGKHYNAPSYEDVKDFFERLKEANVEARKKVFTDFMNKNVNLNKADESMIVTAIVAPPAAMVAKRTGQTVPQLQLMNAIPDVVFVPSATVLALIAVKILRLMFMVNTTSKGATGSPVDHVVQHPRADDIPPPTPAPEAAPNKAPPAQHTPKGATGSSHVDHVVQPPSANDIPPPTPAPAPETETAPSKAPDSQQHTPKGFCHLCQKVH